jgi:hypothetical protein
MDLQAKKFRTGFILFMVSQIMVTLSTLSMGSEFKALPSWLGLFIVFEFFAFITFFFAMLKLYKFNKNFTYAFITYGIYFTMTVFADVSSTSTSDFYLAWSRSMDLICRILLCIFYIYSFIGFHHYFKEIGLEKGAKRMRIGYLSFAGMFLIERVFTFLSTLKAIKLNLVAYTIFKYGAWALNFAIEIYILVMLILVFVMYEKYRKEGGKKNEEVSQ